MLLGNGLGNYPDEGCYDATRPSWYPYWLQWGTEIGCAFAKGTGQSYASANLDTNYPQPAAPPAITSPPLTYQKNLPNAEQGAAIQNQQIADQTAAWKAQMQAQMDDLAGKLPTDCGWYQDQNPETGKCETGGMKLWIALAAASSALILLAVKR